MKLILLMGLQGSGKTTFCKENFPELPRVSLDDCKTRAREKSLFLFYLKEGRDFIVDNTNPTAADRARYIGLAKEYGTRIEGYFLQSRVADCVRRNALRSEEKRVPRLAIAGTSNKLQLPKTEEGFDALFFVKITPTGFEISPWKEL